MWFIPSKRQIKKEFKKISNSFKKRDEKISKQKVISQSLKSQIENNKIKIARLEGMMSAFLSQQQGSMKSQSHKVLISPAKSQGKIETKLINHVRRSKKSLVIAEINKLSPNMSVIEIYESIVLEKGLCSKASYYRYVESLTSLKANLTKTKLRQ